jgi:hypothetical protein
MAGNIRRDDFVIAGSDSDDATRLLIRGLWIASLRSQ